MEEKKLIDTKYFRLWYTPEMFAIGITIDTCSLLFNISIGTLQFIFGKGFDQ